MRTIHRRRARRIVGAAAAALVLAGTGIGYASEASADNGIRCQTDLWGFLGSQRRELCDTPRQADGSWMRSRIVYVPSGWVNGYCSGSRYYWSCSPGYWRPYREVSSEIYPVTDQTKLPDEPGNIR